jgi:gamma-glutamylcyclotransferase (GGCT)/AIG2-like uncharacterized protein YtfP
MKEKCPTANAIGMTILPGWRLQTGTYCNVVEDRDSIVKGVLWDITEADEEALDLYEGVPRYYIKKTVDTIWGPALIYVMNQQYEDDKHSPSDYYSQLVIAAYDEWGIPIMQYLDSITVANVL